MWRNMLVILAHNISVFVVHLVLVHLATDTTWFVRKISNITFHDIHSYQKMV
jgi:hypothetical protein